jgi:hypothetical protein
VECKLRTFHFELYDYDSTCDTLVDLHDGADGRPVVRHSFTFIKDAYLGEILVQIKEFAFYASPYVCFYLI